MQFAKNFMQIADRPSLIVIVYQLIRHELKCCDIYTSSTSVWNALKFFHYATTLCKLQAKLFAMSLRFDLRCGNIACDNTSSTDVCAALP